MSRGRARIVGIVGWSGSGKTTLLERLVPALRGAGVRVAALKHTAHAHPLHPEGSDTDRLQRAGANPVGFQTPEGLQWTRMGAALPVVPPEDCELLFVEGLADGPWPKLEVWRPELGGLRTTRSEELLALVTDGEPPLAIPCYAPSDVEGIARLLRSRLLAQALKTGHDVAAGVTTRPVLRAAEELREEVDPVAVEEPLEIRVAGETVAVTMRTPGDDARLALGYLHAEGLVRGADDVGTIAHCGRPGEEGYGNVIDVAAAPGVDLDLEPLLARARRGTLVTAACGVCGRRSIDDLLDRLSPLAASQPLPADRVRAAVAGLAELQGNFAKTGGVHAAAAFDRDGGVLASAEDVGRHNAVDKVIGRLLLDRALARAALLAVSGRTSFEIVQKAATARIPIVAGVSAASSLAIDLAARSGVTVVAFARGGRFNVYTHRERIAL